MMTIDREGEWKIEGLEVTAPLDSDMYLSLEPLVNQVAGGEWKNSTVYGIDDIAQAIWLDMMEHWPAYEKADEPLKYFMARRAARSYCQQQRVDYMYANGAFLYTPGIVRRMLETTVYCDPGDAPDVDARADITEALGKLTRVQHAAVYKKFALKEPLNGPEKNAESRAITAITHRLNTGLRLLPEGY
jgi:hypothetical protein